MLEGHAAYARSEEHGAEPLGAEQSTRRGEARYAFEPVRGSTRHTRSFCVAPGRVRKWRWSKKTSRLESGMRFASLPSAVAPPSSYPAPPAQSAS